MMGDLQPWHIIILIVVLVLLFGAKRLPDASRSIGRSLRIFKAETKGLRGDDKDDEPSADANPAAAIAPPAPVAAAAPVVAPVVAAPVVAAPVAPAVSVIKAAPVAAPVPAASVDAGSPLANLPFMSQPTPAGRPQA